MNERNTLDAELQPGDLVMFRAAHGSIPAEARADVEQLLPLGRLVVRLHAPAPASAGTTVTLIDVPRHYLRRLQTAHARTHPRTSRPSRDRHRK
jgi:hypothetical protein